MNKDKIICPCKKVSKGDILESMKKGNLTFKEVKKATGAGSKCGHCKNDVKKFIKKYKDDI